MFVARSPPGAGAATAGDPCVICMDDLRTQECLSADCGHEFHTKCLREWVGENENCPVCRQRLRNLDLGTGAVPKRPLTRQRARQANEATVQPKLTEALPSAPRPASVVTRSPAEYPDQIQVPPIQNASSGETQPAATANSGMVATEALLAALRVQISDAVREEIARAREEVQVETVRPPRTSRQLIPPAFESRFSPRSWTVNTSSPRHYPGPSLPTSPPTHVPSQHQQGLFQPQGEALRRFTSQRRGPPRNQTARRSASPIRRWNLSYDGNNNTLDVEEFIFRVETLTNNTLGGDYALLAENLHLLLTGKVSNWLWTLLRQNPSPPWEHVKTALRSDWGEPHSDIEIRRQMLSRRQRPNEPFSAYCLDMVQLRNKLRTPMTEMEFVESVRTNLLPNIQERICLHQASSIGQLRALVTEVQATLSRTRARPPALAYDRHRVEEYHLNAPTLEPPDDTQDGEGQREHVSALNHHQPYSMACWNCDRPGHVYTECNEEPKGFFCYGCGRKGVVKPRCPKCQQGNAKRVEGNNTSPRLNPRHPLNPQLKQIAHAQRQQDPS